MISVLEGGYNTRAEVRGVWRCLGSKSWVHSSGLGFRGQGGRLQPVACMWSLSVHVCPAFHLRIS